MPMSYAFYRPRSRPSLSSAEGQSASTLARTDEGSLSIPATASRAPSLRLTRSIPNLQISAATPIKSTSEAEALVRPSVNQDGLPLQSLRHPTRGHASHSPIGSINRDADGFYRPLSTSFSNPTTPFLPLPTDSTHHLLTPTSSRTSASSRAVTRAHLSASPSLVSSSDLDATANKGDVFGKLLGWNTTLAPHVSVAPSDSRCALRSSQTRSPGSSQSPQQGPGYLSSSTRADHQLDDGIRTSPAQLGALEEVDSGRQYGAGQRLTQGLRTPTDLTFPTSYSNHALTTPGSSDVRKQTERPPTRMPLARASTMTQIPRLQAATSALLSSTASPPSSPFGTGVRLPAGPTVKLKRRKSVGDLRGQLTTQAQASLSQAPSLAVEQSDVHPTPPQPSTSATSTPTATIRRRVLSKDGMSRGEGGLGEELDSESLGTPIGGKSLREAASTETIRTSTVIDEGERRIDGPPSSTLRRSFDVETGVGASSYKPAFEERQEARTGDEANINAKGDVQHPRPHRGSVQQQRQHFTIDTRFFDVFQSLEADDGWRRGSVQSPDAVAEGREINFDGDRHHVSWQTFWYIAAVHGGAESDVSSTFIPLWSSSEASAPPHSPLPHPCRVYPRPVHQLQTKHTRSPSSTIQAMTLGS